MPPMKKWYHGYDKIKQNMLFHGKEVSSSLSIDTATALLLLQIS
jgi:hypothetical protein